jgi:outer membrane protein TolC
MWTNLLRSSFILGLLLIGLRSFAATEITLPELRSEVLSENLDLRIQYEKYYQAQKNIGVARGEFLPSANVQLINVNATLAILQSVVPTPSDWFVYQGSQELAVAEKFTTEGIKLNILEGLTLNYISIKHYEDLLANMLQQESLIREIYEAALAEQELGADNANLVYLTQRQLLQHEQDIYGLETLLLIEKQAMLIATGRDPSEELSLGDLPKEDLSVLPATSKEAALLALDKSNELRSNKFQYQAAQFMASSARWSFVSFDGIGFGYASRLSIEKSKARIVLLEGEKLDLKIRNQVDSAYKQLAILDQRIALQESVLTSTQIIEARQADLFTNGLITAQALVAAKNVTFAEVRTLSKLQFERRMKIIQIKRLLSIDSSLDRDSDVSADAVAIESRVSSNRMGAKVLVLELKGAEADLSNVFSVSYKIAGTTDGARTFAAQGFKYVFKPSRTGSFKVVAVITTLAGKNFEKTLTVSGR